ncbi:hypothetical protein [Nitrospirillum iridis]|uniref:Uncharacterized protein n=1 Tax=Nitrospirillum iridis TaxID=765888 RepID=A0A7X0B1X1_9PROT|nr:hypothetical protein [Nitrospirillum iridis]MBB6253165.1 hypothetical protein [Nitrospirillum iridis]
MRGNDASDRSIAAARPDKPNGAGVPAPELCTPQFQSGDATVASTENPMIKPGRDAKLKRRS